MEISVIRIDNICSGYTNENVIENISFDIKSGELVGILGSNGSGKSTLVKAICNILPHSGSVIIDEQRIEDISIPQIASLISYVPQKSGLNIDISVFDVVMMGFNSRLKLFEKPDKYMAIKATEVIELLGLKEKIHSNYLDLSEGQKQLTILARALVSDGKFIVMDEPESALDFNIRYNIIKIIKDWINNEVRAGLIILHDVNLALNNCDKLILLKDKSVINCIDLRNDSIDSIEEKLKIIYGDITISTVKGKNGKENLVMLFEPERI